MSKFSLSSQRLLIGIPTAIVASVGVAGLIAAGCGSSKTGTPAATPIPTATPTPVPTATPTSGATPLGQVTKSISAAGGTINFTPPTTGGNYTMNFLANAVNAAVNVVVTPIAEANLPVALKSAHVLKTSTRFEPNAGNVYVTAFSIVATGVTAFNVPVGVGATAVPNVTAGTVLNLAKLQGGTWVDIQTFVVGANGVLTEDKTSTTLPGITAPGTYLIYKAAAGTSTAFSNFGVALIADDGFGQTANGIQVVNLYDANGNILTTPGLKFLQYASAYDLDGEALTPDGSQGILVDGGNTVRFFSGVQTGTPVASTTTLDISNYGGDGDSVAILPNGDTAVVSGDSSSELLVVTGIVSGNPKPAITIPTPSSRDGVVITNDGKTLLARGPSGLTVYAITPTTTTTGALGGTISYTFTQVMDFPALGSPHEDGRNGMAVSPADSTRAIIVGNTSGATDVTLLTGLPSTPVLRTMHPTIPAPSASVVKTRGIRAHAEGDTRAPLVPSGVSDIYSVSITPNGKFAICGTDAGLLLVSGVDGTTLAQVGTTFNPTITLPASAGSTTTTTSTLGMVPTLGITLDGNYVVVLTPQPSSSSGALFVFPITATGFGGAVSQLNGLAIPGNDQLVIH